MSAQNHLRIGYLLAVQSTIGLAHMKDQDFYALDMLSNLGSDLDERAVALFNPADPFSDAPPPGTVVVEPTGRTTTVQTPLPTVTDEDRAAVAKLFQTFKPRDPLREFEQHLETSVDADTQQLAAIRRANQERARAEQDAIDEVEKRRIWEAEKLAERRADLEKQNAARWAASAQLIDVNATLDKFGYSNLGLVLIPNLDEPVLDFDTAKAAAIQTGPAPFQSSPVEARKGPVGPASTMADTIREIQTEQPDPLDQRAEAFAPPVLNTGDPLPDTAPRQDWSAPKALDPDGVNFDGSLPTRQRGTKPILTEMASSVDEPDAPIPPGMPDYTRVRPATA